MLVVNVIDSPHSPVSSVCLAPKLPPHKLCPSAQTNAPEANTISFHKV